MLQLPYTAMSGSLFSNDVITFQQKLEVDKMIGEKQMEKVLDILIQSLYCGNITKYMGFLKAMKENDDLDLQSKAKDLDM